MVIALRQYRDFFLNFLDLVVTAFQVNAFDSTGRLAWLVDRLEHRAKRAGADLGL